MKTAMAGLLALVAVGAFAACDKDTVAKISAGHKIIREDTFCKHDRVVFDFEGHEAWIVFPKDNKAREGKPWTWTMQWATAFVPRTNVPQMLEDGYHHVTIEQFDERMDEKGLALSAAFQKYLVETLGFAPKANLIGMSWGGFFSVRYAAAHPENVRKIYLDAPLLSFQKFRFGNGSWDARMPADGLWIVDPEMPVNKTEAIAKAGIPVLLLYGGQDQTVPPEYNAELFEKRFKNAGGDIKVVQRGGFGHHPHGVDLDDTTIKDFFDAALPVAKKLPTVWLLGDSIRLSYQARVSELLNGEAIVGGPRENCASTWHWLEKGTIENVYLENRHYDVIHANVGVHDMAFRRNGSGKTEGGAENCIFPERYPEFEGNFDMTKPGFPGDLTIEQRNEIVKRLGFHVRTSPEEYEANLRLILRELKKHADTVIFALTTPTSVWATRIRVSPLTKKFNEIARRVCAEEGVLIDDLETAGIGLLDHQLNDGCHFDPTGVDKLAETVADCIRKNLKKGN